MKNLNSSLYLSIVTLLLLAVVPTTAQNAPPQPDNHAGKVELKIKLPPNDYTNGWNIHPGDTNADWATLSHRRGPFYVPPGVTNVALHKPVTSSDDRPIIGNSRLITDGNKEKLDDHWVTYAPGKQWVQIDLKKDDDIYAIVIWHYWGELRVYRDVVVQVSDDAQFIKGVHTLFNNDARNELGLGAGTDWEYFETEEGKLIDAKGIKGRYVRLYSKGNTSDDENNYTEVEVYGKTASTKLEPVRSATQAAPSPARHPDEHGDKVELKITPPRPPFWSGPPPLPTRFPKQHRPPFYVPRGVTNVALHKPVTASDDRPIIGTLNLVTDGDKESSDGSWVTFAPGKQWVQIDLQKSYNLYAIVVWHYHAEARVYHDVVVQVSDDEDFVNNVHTVFNADQHNDLGLGNGKDRDYFESNEGKLIDPKGIKGRYVRLYSNGNTSNDENNYTEVEVYGKIDSTKPAPGKSAARSDGKVPLKLVLPKPPYRALPG